MATARKGSDMSAAFTGLILAAAVIFLVLGSIVLLTNAHFAGKEHAAPAPARAGPAVGAPAPVTAPPGAPPAGQAASEAAGMPPPPAPVAPGTP